MASQQVPAVTPPAAVIGNVFVQQYYNVLHQSPALVYRFYNDSSKLGRPDPNGEMSCITTLDAINEKILSLDYSEYRAEIKTVDSQESYNQGVTVLVTGALLGRDDVKRNFTQSFFLAPQDKGYFVLNDVFRFLDEPQQEETRTVLVNGVADPVSQDSQSVAVVAEPTPTVVAEPAPTVVAEPTPAQELQAVEQSPQLEEETHVEEDDVSPSKNAEEGSAAEEEASPTQATETPALPSGEKKSYASIVKVMKENSATVQAPTVARTTPTNVERQAIVPTQTSSPPPAPEPATPPSTAPEINNSSEAEAADGRSIYIKNLPLTATTTQLEQEFKKFGPIKPGGVQVRSNKQAGFCYGFVEFEASSSMHSALEASPITIGGRPAHVEEKRPAGSRAPRGRFPSGRGGFRNDVIRGRGGYGGRGTYGRGDFANRGDFGGRGRGSGSGRGGASEGYQRVDHVGNGGRGARSGGTNQTHRNVQRDGPSTG